MRFAHLFWFTEQCGHLDAKPVSTEYPSWDKGWLRWLHWIRNLPWPHWLHLLLVSHCSSFQLGRCLQNRYIAVPKYEASLRKFLAEISASQGFKERGLKVLRLGISRKVDTRNWAQDHWKVLWEPALRMIYPDTTMYPTRNLVEMWVATKLNKKAAEGRCADADHPATCTDDSCFQFTR